MSFLDELNKVLGEDCNTSVTENGAVGYATTQKSLLDINFKLSSYRNANADTILSDFMNAFREDKVLAMRWLFYVRDAREGLGERRYFRIVISYLAKMYPELIRKVLPLLAEYGRYDDLFVLLDNKDLSKDIVKIVMNTLVSDIANMKENKPITLLAKWLPSENTSSKETVRKARLLIKELGIPAKKYRKVLSSLRKYLKVVEVNMSSKEWGSINYQEVPSRANLIYNGAFLRNDEERRREFLGALEKGEVKINASTLFPHDIVHKYGVSIYSLGSLNATLEGLWKALPNTVEGNDSTIVVADGSGSMTSRVGNTDVSAIEIANALAIYFAERCNGEFKNKYITFSETPKLVRLNGDSLLSNLKIAMSHNEVANTNVEAVFDLILTTAVRYNMKQEELPSNILIISDMEFDSATGSGAYYWRGSNYNNTKVTKKLFQVIADKYRAKGYTLPRLVFWNVNSRTGTIPVKENEAGVALVSGFSPNVAKMVMSNKTDPYEALLDTIKSERYNAVEEAINS